MKEIKEPGVPYRDYPIQVSIETATICNAHCDFCPHHTLERKGHIMDMQLIEKIVDELIIIPQPHCPEIALNGVNEPLADKRIINILNVLTSRIPWASIYIVTNGSLLTGDLIDTLTRYNLSRLCISLNFQRPADYEKHMGLSWGKISANLDALHGAIQTKRFPKIAHLSRVIDGSKDDTAFTEWVRSTYPHFQPWLKRPGDWLGTVVVPNHKHESTTPKCPQWPYLHIASTGAVMHCCMDAHARYPWGNIQNMGLLDIYNQPAWARLRHEDITRLDVTPCKSCTYLL